MNEITEFISTNAPVFYVVGGLAVLCLAAVAVFKKPKFLRKRR